MDDLRGQFNNGRRQMVEAFADLTTLVCRAGVDLDAITALHGTFFDGNVQVKRAFSVTLLLVEVFRPKPGA